MSATFVLTPGRCGTQWLTQQLRSKNSKNWVCHEPLHFDYAPLHNSPSQPLNTNKDRLSSHLASIHKHLGQGNHYLECGFPCWRHLDWFKQELGEHVKLIHIHRDPVENSTSLLKLNAFVPPVLPHLPEKQLFHPQAPESAFPEYADHWGELSPFEKNLYYWAEVNQQADLYKTNFASTHVLTIPYRELFSRSSLERIAEFANLDFLFAATMLENEDQFQGIPQSPILSEKIYGHPKIITIATRLGYAY